MRNDTTITALILFILLITPYIWNAIKFTNCDFEEPYTCEIVHGVGLIPLPLAFVTVWFGDDSK